MEHRNNENATFIKEFGPHSNGSISRLYRGIGKNGKPVYYLEREWTGAALEEKVNERKAAFEESQRRTGIITPNEDEIVELCKYDTTYASIVGEKDGVLYLVPQVGTGSEYNKVCGLIFCMVDALNLTYDKIACMHSKAPIIFEKNADGIFEYSEFSYNEDVQKICDTYSELTGSVYSMQRH